MSEMILEKLKASETDFEKIGLPKLEKEIGKLKMFSKKHFEKSIDENEMYEEWKEKMESCRQENKKIKKSTLLFTIIINCLVVFSILAGENKVFFLSISLLTALMCYFSFSSKFGYGLKDFETYRYDELNRRYHHYLKTLVLTKDEITPLYETLHNYYGEEQFSIEIKRAKKEDEEVGSYTLLKRLYDNAINHEKENAKRQRQSESGEELNAQVRLLLQK